MKKRLRKKLHLREFQVFAFQVTGSLADGVSRAGEDAITDALIAFVEAHGLLMAGSLQASGISIYVDRGRDSATNDDRELVGAWLRSRPEVVSIDVHPLVDAWYPDGPPSVQKAKRLTVSRRKERRVDADIAEGRADLTAGRYSSFDTAEAMLRHLHAAVAKDKKPRRKEKRP